MPEIVKFTLTISKSLLMDLTMVKSHLSTRKLHKKLNITLEL